MNDHISVIWTLDFDRNIIERILCILKKMNKIFTVVYRLFKRVLNYERSRKGMCCFNSLNNIHVHI